ncbi:kynureninase [Streptomyces sp. NPDC006990]|uniref:kynureninase n=1 Tax=unclassified Streptomyces TaxID=2593676 RepID=UPI003456FA68
MSERGPAEAADAPAAQGPAAEGPADRGPAAEALAAEALALDAADPLAALRERFVLDPATVYLDGNSLGALPEGVEARLVDVVSREWGRLRIRSWAESGWWTMPERVGELVAPLVGAGPGQVVVSDSTSVNLLKALVGAVRVAREQDPDRGELLVDAATFPTDGYIAESAARLTGCTVRAVPPEEVPAALGPRTAAVLLNHVDYRTGELRALPALTSAAHAAGALTVWDLCHSAGALPVDLDAHGVDFAVGCTYKFLNGGPGSPAFLYVRGALQERFDSPLPGWNSHADPFAMAPDYTPASGAVRGRVGTPDILSMAALESALGVWDGVRIQDVRAKSLALTDFFLRCVAAHAAGGALGVRSLTPAEHARRGSQIALLCDPPEQAEPVMRELIARGVVGDFRRPGVLRFGFTPLYTSFRDAERAARVLGEVIGGAR